MRVNQLLVAIVTGSLLMPVAGPTWAARAELDLGNIEIGFSDGYWDNDHHWHRWENKRDAQYFREKYREHYHTWRHDHDPDPRWHQEREH